MSIKTLRDVEQALHPYYVVAAETTGKDVTADRTKNLLSLLGSPQNKLHIVHIAGTSGKTSTAYYIATLLHASGNKVGLTVSPHIDSLTERVQINGSALSEKAFCAYMETFLKKVRTTEIVPSWFELMVAFSYWVFAEEGVDYAVIETGLGGLHDATNVVEQRDKLCIITDIGMDHMQILGTTIGSIAHQKAGIIHEGNVVLMYEQDQEIMQVVRYYVSQQEDAELLTFQQGRLAQAYKGEFTAHMPKFQKRNWLLAFAAFKYLVRRDDIADLSAEKLRGSMTVRVPARMQTKKINGKTVILDGAHNAQKMQALIDSYKAEHGDEKATVLLALKEGKEAADLAPLLATIASEVIVTRFERTQDMPIQSQGPADLAQVLTDFGIHVEVEENIESAYARALARPGIVLITGSFYFIAQLRDLHKELQ